MTRLPLSPPFALGSSLVSSSLRSWQPLCTGCPGDHSEQPRVTRDSR